MEYLLFLQNIREGMSPLFNDFMNASSNFVINEGSLLIFMIALYIYDKRLGRKICASYGFNILINIWIKNIVCISRPWIKDSRIVPAEGMKESAGGFSFPSGHTSNAGSLFFPIIVYVKNNVLTIISIIAISIIGFSRNYISVHTFEDVACGLLFSIIGCMVIFKVMDYIEKDEYDEKGHTKIKVDNRDIIVCIIMIILCVVGTLHVEYKSYPTIATEAEILNSKAQMLPVAVLTIGYFIGMTLERRFIKYNNDVSMITKIIRVVVGYIVFFIYNKCISPIAIQVFSKAMSGVIKYGLILFIVTFVIPLIFTTYEKLFKLK